MTCGMCSACGTFFCGSASASVATPSTRLIHLKRRRMQTTISKTRLRRGRRPRPERAGLGRLPRLPRAAAGVALGKRQAPRTAARHADRGQARRAGPVQARPGLRTGPGRGPRRRQGVVLVRGGTGGYVKAMFAYAICWMRAAASQIPQRRWSGSSTRPRRARRRRNFRSASASLKEGAWRGTRAGRSTGSEGAERRPSDSLDGVDVVRSCVLVHCTPRRWRRRCQ